MDDPLERTLKELRSRDDSTRQLWRAIEPQISAQPSGSMGTVTQRSLILIGVAFVTFAPVMMMDLRPDLAQIPMVRIVGTLISLTALLGLSIWHSVRGWHQPLIHRAWLIGFQAVLGGTLLALCFLPGPVHEPGGDDLMCQLHGGAVGVLMFGVAMALSRGLPYQRLSAVAIGVLAANAALFLGCGSDDLRHLLLAHAIVLPAMWMVAGAHYLYSVRKARSTATHQRK